MADIRKELPRDHAKKIFGNASRGKEYLELLNQKDVQVPNIANLKNLKSWEIYQLISDTWRYPISKEIVRDLFQKSDKFLKGKQADEALCTLRKEWRLHNLGKVEWPISQGDFDNFVQRVNSEGITTLKKDEKVQDAAMRYRRIKEINTARNDFIETLIFESNTNILPTLDHRRGVDFYIDGVPYDQKVSKSPTRQFKSDFSNWRDHAMQNPDVVAQYLYQHQDEGRFDADPRLLIVYLDEDIPASRISKIIDKTDLRTPLNISFTFRHKSQGEKNYQVSCFVILLHT